jgi:hypothetical protein
MNVGKLFRHFVVEVVVSGVGVILAMAPQSASAQGIIVSNQFSFSVNNQQYPAGTYQFTLETPWLLSIHGADGGNTNLYPIRPEDSGPLGSHGRLTFYNCQGHQTLQAIYIPGTDMTAELIGVDNTTNHKKTHGPRPSMNCLPEKGAVRERNAKGR